jgi:hypothetical protein
MFQRFPIKNTGHVDNLIESLEMEPAESSYQTMLGKMFRVGVINGGELLNKVSDVISECAGGNVTEVLTNHNNPLNHTIYTDNSVCVGRDPMYTQITVSTTFDVLNTTLAECVRNGTSSIFNSDPEHTGECPEGTLGGPIFIPTVTVAEATALITIGILAKNLFDTCVAYCKASRKKPTQTQFDDLFDDYNSDAEQGRNAEQHVDHSSEEEKDSLFVAGGVDDLRNVVSDDDTNTNPFNATAEVETTETPGMRFGR